MLTTPSFWNLTSLFAILMLFKCHKYAYNLLRKKKKTYIQLSNSYLTLSVLWLSFCFVFKTITHIKITHFSNDEKHCAKCFWTTQQQFELWVICRRVLWVFFKMCSQSRIGKFQNSTFSYFSFISTLHRFKY